MLLDRRLLRVDWSRRLECSLPSHQMKRVRPSPVSANAVPLSNEVPLPARV